MHFKICVKKNEQENSNIEVKEGKKSPFSRSAIRSVNAKFKTFTTVKSQISTTLAAEKGS